MVEAILSSIEEYPYFKEYIESLLNPNRQIVLYSLTNTQTIPHFDKYLCIRRIPFSVLPTNSIIGFVNTEQLSVPSKFHEYNQIISRGNINIFDYSIENIKISNKGIYLPYTENLKETEKLKGFLSQPKKYDFAVIGTLSDHRSKMMNKVSSQGYSVLFITGWGDERDNNVGKCRALLNIHYNSEYKLYEPIRCERWRFAGMPIYSEYCIDEVSPNIKIINNFSNFKLDI